MGRYALITNPRSWMTLVTGVENPIHAECGEPMRHMPGDSERYSCSTCLKVGHLMAENTGEATTKNRHR